MFGFGEAMSRAFTSAKTLASCQCALCAGSTTPDSFIAISYNPCSVLVKLGCGKLSSEAPAFVLGSSAEGSGILAGRKLNHVGRLHWRDGKPGFPVLLRHQPLVILMHHLRAVACLLRGSALIAVHGVVGAHKRMAQPVAPVLNLQVATQTQKRFVELLVIQRPDCPRAPTIRLKPLAETRAHLDQAAAARFCF